MRQELEPDIARVREEAAIWCARLGEGALPLEQQIEFEVWLERAPEHRTTFVKMIALWEDVQAAAGSPELIAARADALKAMREAGQRRWSLPFTIDWRPVAALAAVLVAALVFTLHLLPAASQIYETGVGERRVVQLDDGSKISLDSATKVRVAYSGERRVLTLLDGRAKFDVAKDPRRPFSVSAGTRMVIATGTAFSVELLSSQMRVVLYEGHVAVLEQGPSDAPPQPLKLGGTRANAEDALKPGTELIAPFSHRVARVVDTDLPKSVAWQGGQISFTDEPLAIAVERVNRYSDEKLRVDDLATAGLSISGSFNAGDTAGFIDGVSTLFPVTAERKGAVTTLRLSPSGP